MFNDYGYLAEYWDVFSILFLIVVGISLAFYFSQYNLLNAISPKNRLLVPSYVFLQFIPFFGSIYSFIVVAKIADSIRLEADNRHLIDDGDLLGKPPLVLDENRPTYNIGLAWCILSLCYIIPNLGGYAGIAGFVCWLIYWSKIAAMKKLIMAN